MPKPKRAKAPEPTQPSRIETYGFPPGYQQLHYDCGAFALRKSIDQGAPTRMQLFKRISDVLLPGRFEWHEWTRRRISTMVDNQNSKVHLVAFTGCSSAGKTYDLANFAVTWWLAEPKESSVMFISTTIKALRQRGWNEIAEAYTSIPGERIGNFVDSKMMWQISRGDDKHAIFGRAVEEGNMAKVADNLKGVHTKRQMVIIDEANAIPEAIWDACTNLYSYPREFILVAMANPRSRLERFSRFMEPAGGWMSVTLSDMEWEGKPQADYGNAPVKVVRFASEDSPNIKQGRLVSKHLPTKERVEAAKLASGGGHSPNYWTNELGFPPAEGMTKTVFTESAITINDGYGKLIFSGDNTFIIGAFDLAFGGGDRPCIRFAKIGLIETQKWGIQLLPPILVPLNVNSSNPVDYQLVEYAKRNCEAFYVNGVKYSCLPENFAFDATGRGGAVVSIAQRIWSPKVMGVDFGGAASEDSVSLEDIRPANEVYRNKRAEMWFRSRNAMDHGQLKGMDAVTAQELCNMEFEDLASDGRSKPIVLMAKKDYKAKFGKSPDYGDATVILLEVARRKGFKLAAQGHTANKFDDFDKTVQATQAVYEEIEYTEELPEESLV